MKPFNGQQLVGYVSPETAYVVDDYPYGFRLRCKIRYWVETKPGFGQRFVSQTTNPKVPGECWNKPKACTYHPLVVMFKDADTGYVKHAVCSVYATLEAIESFGDLVLNDHQGTRQKMLLEVARRARGAA